MITEKIYDRDSHIDSFKATVLDCLKIDEHYGIILDKTAFFPEGGGQPADTGFIGNARIYDVKINDKIITHYSETPVPVNTEVECHIDWDQRFRRMQNHSGEHIVS